MIRAVWVAVTVTPLRVASSIGAAKLSGRTVAVRLVTLVTAVDASVALLGMGVAAAIGTGQLRAGRSLGGRATLLVSSIRAVLVSITELVTLQAPVVAK